MSDIDSMTDAEFDAAYGGRDLLPIEQLIYEQEGAERFARTHNMNRMNTNGLRPHPACENWAEVDKWVGDLNKLARKMDAAAEGLHPEMAFNQSKELRDEWKRIAVQPAKEPA